MARNTNMTSTLLAVGAVLALAGCREPDLSGGQRGARRVVKANIAEFDPNADIELDAYFGDQRPDEYALEQAFNQTFDAMDQCITTTKKQLGLRGQMEGTANFAVKLDPKSSRPMGVNAEIPRKYASKGDLEKCLREAVAAAPYPTYAGPPVVANFETELDPGSDWVED